VATPGFHVVGFSWEDALGCLKEVCLNVDERCLTPDTCGQQPSSKRGKLGPEDAPASPERAAPDEPLAHRLALQPNPARQTTTLQYRLASPTRLVLRDAYGRRVRTLQPLEGRGRRELSLRALSAGVYTLTAYPADGHPIVKRLVVQE
jgi:hypothetical protein